MNQKTAEKLDALTLALLKEIIRAQANGEKVESPYLRKSLKSLSATLSEWGIGIGP